MCGYVRMKKHEIGNWGGQQAYNHHGALWKKWWSKYPQVLHCIHRQVKWWSWSRNSGSIKTLKCPNDSPWVGCFVQNLSQGPKPPNTKTLQLIPQKGLCWSSSFLQMPWTLDKTWPDSVISDIFWSSHKKCRDFHGFWCVLVDPGADARAWARFASGCPTCWSAEGVFDANGGFHDARACDCHWTPRHESLHRLRCSIPSYKEKIVVSSIP